MTNWANNLILLCLVLLLFIVLIDSIIHKKLKSLIINLLIIGLVVLILRVTINFPDTSISFGGVTPVLAILIMFGATCLGMGAWYIRTARKLNWINFMKTLVISPIVLIPMIGTVQGASQIEPIQMITFALLSFQNGYFWKTILDQTQKQLANSKRPDEKTE